MAAQLLREANWELLVPASEPDSVPSSAVSYSSDGHDGLTDAEFGEFESATADTPACPPVTPAPEKDRREMGAFLEVQREKRENAG